MNSLQLIHKSQKALHTIIFIHGFTGGTKTFYNKNKHFSSNFDKSILEYCDIYEFYYYSKLLDFKAIKTLFTYMPFFKNIVQCKYNVDLNKYSELLITHCDNFNNSYLSVNFICHSMGGIIAKRFLIDQFRTKGKPDGFYITLATPHRGVTGAKLMPLLKNIHIQSLDPFSDFIENVTESWDNICTKFNRRYYCAIHDQIVDDKSASPTADKKHLVRVDGSHISIAKPDSSSTVLMKNVNKTIVSFLKLNQTTNEYQYIKSEDVLFYAYKKEYDIFYLNRNQDNEIYAILKNSNLWLHGKSGTGKTNIILHYLANNEVLSLFIDLSPCSPESSVDDIFEMIYWSLKNQLEKNYSCGLCIEGAGGWFNKISELFSSIDQRIPICVFIDEIFIKSSTTYEEFIETLTRLTSYYLNSCHATKEIRFIVSTLTDPRHFNSSSLSSSEKFQAIFVKKELQYWCDDDMHKLSRIINNYLSTKLTVSDRYKLVRAATGSPRKLKILYRKFIDLNSIEDAITELEQEGLT